MGCWHGTCFITNQAIRVGEDVALILIKQTDWKYLESDIGGGGFCESDTFFRPVQYTFFGEYNDYGSIENYDEKTKNVIESIFPTLIGRKDGGHSDVDIFHFIERGELEEVKRCSYVMIKKPIYDLLVQEFGKRVPYAGTMSYRDDLIKAVDIALEFKKTIISTALPPIEQKWALTELFSKNHFSQTLMSNWEDYYDKSNFIDTKVFISAVSLMRKFWFPQTGAGAQQDETYLHHMVNKKMTELYEADREEAITEATEEPDIYNEKILRPDYRHGEETLYWSPTERVQKIVRDFNKNNDDD